MSESLKMKLTVSVGIEHGDNVTTADAVEKVKDAVGKALETAMWLYLPGKNNRQGDHITVTHGEIQLGEETDA